MALFQQQKYVRVTAERPDGFVEFDFSLGDPDLYVELIMPQDMFSTFCESNGVSFLTDREAAAIDADRQKWSQSGL